MTPTTTGTEIVHIDPEEYGLSKNEAKKIESAFLPMIDKMTELEDRFNEIASRDIGPDLCKEAKRLRLDYAKVRTATAAIHKTAKAYYLSGGRFVDGWKNAQLFASQGKETALREIEEHYERIEKDRIEALQTERESLIEPYDMDGSLMNLGSMDDQVWDSFLVGAKLRHEQRVEAERKAEADRLAEIEKEKERQRVRDAENKRLKAEAAKREKAIAAERAKAEAEAARREKALEKERALARAEKAKREKAEAELRLKREAEERERIAAAQREEAEKAKSESDKFDDFVSELLGVTRKYSFRSNEFKEYHATVSDRVERAVESFLKVAA